MGVFSDIGAIGRKAWEVRPSQGYVRDELRRLIILACYLFAAMAIFWQVPVGALGVKVFASIFAVTYWTLNASDLICALCLGRQGDRGDDPS